MSVRSYREAIIANRTRNLKLMRDFQKLIDKHIGRAFRDISSMILGIGAMENPITLQQWRSATNARELGAIIELFRNGFNEDLIAAMNQTVGSTVKLYSNETNLLLAARGLEAVNFTAINAAALPEVLTRIGSDGLILSDRIWRLGTNFKSQIDRIVLSSIAQGRSAIDTSKALRQFIKSPLDRDSISDIRKLRGESRRLGQTLRSSSLRMARTEIHNAFWETSVRSARKSPVVIAQKWNLSAGHGDRVGFDICDVLADSDMYGLGGGVYPTGNVPIVPHPNDICFLTDVIRPAKDWGKKKPIFKRRDLRSFTPDMPNIGTQFGVAAPRGLGSTIQRNTSFTQNARDRLLADFRSAMASASGR